MSHGAQCDAAAAVAAAHRRAPPARARRASVRKRNSSVMTPTPSAHDVAVPNSSSSDSTIDAVGHHAGDQPGHRVEHERHDHDGPGSGDHGERDEPPHHRVAEAGPDRAFPDRVERILHGEHQHRRRQQQRDGSDDAESGAASRCPSSASVSARAISSRVDRRATPRAVRRGTTGRRPREITSPAMASTHRQERNEARTARSRQCRRRGGSCDASATRRRSRTRAVQTAPAHAARTRSTITWPRC